MEMIITIPYYEDNTRISNSNIGQYLKYGPMYLRNYLDGKEEGLRGKFLEKGTMTHMWFLQRQEFWENYIIHNFSTPTSKQQVSFAEEVANTTEIDPDLAVLSAYQSIYSTKGKSDDKMLLDARELADKLSDYIEYLRICKKNRTAITWADMEYLKTLETNVRNHKKANKLLFDVPATCEVHNEFQINWQFSLENGNKIDCKSLLDRFTVDHTTKIIQLIDLKTTANAAEFSKSFEEYKYARQLQYYWLAIEWYFANILEKDIAEYSRETYIIALQTTSPNNVKVFTFTHEDLNKENSIISDTLSRIRYHQEENAWEHSVDYYLGDGAEKLT